MPLKMNSHLNTTYFEDFLYIEKQCSSYIYIISMMFISLVPIIMFGRTGLKTRDNTTKTLKSTTCCWNSKNSRQSHSSSIHRKLC